MDEYAEQAALGSALVDEVQALVPMNIAGISDHIAELEAMCENLSWLSQEKTLLAQMTGLIQARRDSAAASDDLREVLERAEKALVIHWHGFMKTAAEVLNEQDDAATIARAAT